MTNRRSLNLKLILSVLAAFLLSLAFSWFLHDRLSERDAYALIDRTFDNVQDELADCVNERLVLVCMAAREQLEDGHPDDPASMQKLARELRFTEVSIADEKGDIVRSSVDDYLARPGRPAFNFATTDDKVANEMMGLVDGRYTEYCQPFRSNPANGNWRKFVGVWRHAGGFFEIGCDAKALQSLARSTCVDLFRNWHVGGTGGIVVTTPSGLVLSDYEEPNREGTQFQEPDGEIFYWKRKEIESFPVYVMIPKGSAAVQRDVLVGSTALLNGVALVFVALLVGFVISAFVRQQMRAQAAKEMKMATDIQLSALPNVFPPAIPRRRREREGRPCGDVHDAREDAPQGRRADGQADRAGVRGGKRRAQRGQFLLHFRHGVGRRAQHSDGARDVCERGAQSAGCPARRQAGAPEVASLACARRNVWNPLPHRRDVA